MLITLTQIDLEQAYSRISKDIKKTPLIRSSFLSKRWEADVFLKCEQYQEIGAFKIRGAANFCRLLYLNSYKNQLITHSSGNHAQAVAYMASLLGYHADIVMPSNSNKVKIANAKRWGATIHLCEPTIESRETTAHTLVKEKKGVLVPPYDHEWIIAGQATASMESFKEVPFIDIIMTPLGGGGLLSGTCLARNYFSKQTEVVGSEPNNARDGFEGLKMGKRVKSHKPNTIADGLRTTVGEIPFQILKSHLDKLWLAPEEDIRYWFYTFLREERMVVEPSCVVPIAAADQQKNYIKGKRIVIVMIGGNVDFNNLP